MKDPAHPAVAIVGVGAVLPDAPDAATFWSNLEAGRYSISDVDPERWDPELYYDPDPKAPDKCYTKIGGWVREWDWDPLGWRLPIPPRVAEGMDRAQKWAIVGTREVLSDYGYPERHLDPARTAVILGNAMAGDKHYMTALRAYMPEYVRELSRAESFAELPEPTREAIRRELSERIAERFPVINEDTMPGELANIIAGRIANIFDFHGPNYVVDAACASAMAAIHSAIEGLEEHDYDAVITGGVDANMSASSYIKFCKIGALSATGTRPYAEGADGFVMGEGASLLLLKRLDAARRDGDRIYAVIRSVAGSSDGKGKGITAPNPVGQRLAVERAWKRVGLRPAAGDYIEGHGTSTRVGDVVEVDSLVEAFEGLDLPVGSIALGSVKSNVGHLKGAAGATGVLKAALCLDNKKLPPSLGFARPNPSLDFEHLPLRVNTELLEWEKADDGPRRAGVSAFGFGGTNFHVVMEEYVPELWETRRASTAFAGTEAVPAAAARPAASAGPDASARLAASARPAAAAGATEARGPKSPLRGALMIGAATRAELTARLDTVTAEAAAGPAPEPAPPSEADLRAPVRLALDFEDAGELAAKVPKALKEIERSRSAIWSASRAQGIFVDEGDPAPVAFLYTGQGSQYVNMLAELRDREPVVAATFAEADRVMEPLLGKPLSELIFVPADDPDATARAARSLRQTEITQPAVLTVDVALTRLLAEYGIVPDMAMGHSLGEYGALVAAGALSFAVALEAVSARGKGMAAVSVGDNGTMAAVLGPLEEVEEVIGSVEGYVVVANINSSRQAVIGGATDAVSAAIEALQEAGYRATPLEVSHAFHTSIVAPASDPLREVLRRLDLHAPGLPIISNVTGDFYPGGPGAVDQMIGLLGRQVASPVQFVAGLNRLYEAGARVFVEVGPKSALHGFVKDVLGENDDARALFTNHPKLGDLKSFNHALCGLYAAGHGVGAETATAAPEPVAASTTVGGTTRIPDAPTAADASMPAAGVSSPPAGAPAPVSGAPAPGALPPGGAASPAVPFAPGGDDRYLTLGRIFADAIQQGMRVLAHEPPTRESIVISGAALGLPGTERVFDDANVARILRGEQLISTVPERFRAAMVDKNITRLVKGAAGEASFETIADPAEAIKLAGRGGELDLVAEFGFPADRLPALDVVTRLAIGAGIDALRDAGIPLVMRYKTTTTGKELPERWGLADALRDDTGVIFASAFPGYDALIDEVTRHFQDPDSYRFDRRFLFKILAMGHSQFAELIGARGPNTQINAACASGGQALTLAEDWIRSGRCRRVIVVSADDTTSDNLMEWIGAGFLASGAAATDETVEDAAIPFDRRRHGLIVGMGAAAMVVETAEAVRDRGMVPICEMLATEVANSAFHGSRLDVEHICKVMEALIAKAERVHGIDRYQIAPQTVFVSHETYTPARGGSAQAEASALRRVFGASVDDIVVANTKGFTGHPMGVGIEEVVAVKSLETGLVPPVPNHRDLDPELGSLNLSRGGTYPIHYALRLAAGFGSQISFSLLRWVPPPDGVRREPHELGYTYRIFDGGVWRDWLQRISGYPGPELEVAQRTLRVKDQGAPARVPAIREAVAAATPAMAPGVPAAPTVVPGAPAAPAVAPGAPAAPAVASGAAEAPAVAERILRLVAAQTGYPADMLEMDLDLEADLGIDTVKQAEMFAAIREEYSIERDDTLQLRDFPTLEAVVGFVYERRPDLAPAAASAGPTSLAAPAMPSVDVPSSAMPAVAAPSTAPPVAAPPGPTVDAPPTIPPADAPSAAPPADPVGQRILELVTEQTGYPPDMLEMDLDLEADLGIDTVKQAEMFAAIREEYGIERDDTLQLRDFPTLQAVVGFVYDRRPDLKIATGVIPEPAAPSEAAPTGDPVGQRILELVAEQTGYPPDMLEMDLDLEADLGIDTVKQAEMFAAIREEYGIERDDTLQLRDFPTLAAVVGFVYDRVPDLEPTAPAAAAQPPPAETVPEGAAAAAGPIVGSMEAADAVPRRVPTPLLRPPLDLCKPTGVELGSGARVIVAPDQNGVGAALIERLKDRGVQALTLDPTAEPAELEGRFRDWLDAGPVHGLYWLPALDPEPELADMDPDRWREAVDVRVKALYRTMRALYEQIGEPGAFVIAATRMGGLHGYDAAGAHAPLGGAVAGLTKTFKRERPEALVKVVDFAPSRATQGPAGALIDETLTDPGAVEIGYHEGHHRWTIGLTELPSRDEGTGLALGKDTVFVVTGAAGSIVSAITSDLAAASGGVFHLLDLVSEPDPDNPDLERFVTDRDGLKLELFERIKARGDRATPALVEKELAAIERGAAAQAAIRAVTDAGGEAHYYSVNLLDHEAVAAVIDRIREVSGRVDVLVHAAGLEISHLLPDKAPEEFDLVFDVKANGFFNLLDAIGEMPLGATVVFSSIAGRFGNGGQADYSAANDLLCKISSSFRTTRPSTRGIAIDWTAWGGIGMATRGSIPTIMEQAGIDMLAPEAGIPVVRRELTRSDFAGEVMIAEALGILLEEWDGNGGLDNTRVALQPEAGTAGVMVGNVIGLRQGALAVETILDPAAQPFLNDHRIDGTAVLPGVMGIEAFAEVARLLFPDLHVVAVENVEFLAPFKFYRDEPRTLTIEARYGFDGDDIVADCRLVGSRRLVGRDEPEVTTHFRGRVRLGAEAPEVGGAEVPEADSGETDRTVGADDVYRIYFHGPAYRVVEVAWGRDGGIVGRLTEPLPENHRPAHLPSAMEPRLIELCFQTAGIWDLGVNGRMALPQRLGRVTTLRPLDEAEGHLYALASSEDDGFVARVIDDSGRTFVTLSGYRTIEVPGAVDGERLGPLRQCFGKTGDDE